MQKKDIITLALLITATLLTAVLSANTESLKYAVLLILIVSSVKFILVAFNFMELKKAHVFWKIILIGFLIVFVGIVGIIV